MRLKYIGAIAALLVLNGCAASLPQVNKADYQPQNLSSYQQRLEQKDAEYAAGTIQNPSGAVTIKQAAALTLRQNPGLAAFPYEIRAQEAEALQAGLLPNPEVETEFEDFTGTGDFDDGERVEVTAFYRQLILLGGKRKKRYQLKLWESELARWDYRIAKTDVLTRLVQRYITVLAEQERVALLEELVQLSEESLYAISQRVQAGAASPMQEMRAEVELATQRNALDAARQDLKASKTMLAVVWGASQPQFDTVSGQLERLLPLPELAALTTNVQNNPDLQRWAAEMQRRRAVLDVEEAQAVPDITLTGGLRFLNEADEGTLVGAISLPLTIYDRNQGGIEAARQRLQKARVERQAVLLEVQSTLVSRYQQLQGVKAEIKRLQEEILPSAEAAYQAIQEGFRQGGFDYLDVLDAQRTLFESRVRYVQVLARFHQQWIAIERLIGQPLQDNLPERSE